MGSELSDWIYIYIIRGDNLLIYDRTVSRKGLGPGRAKERVAELESMGYEAFFTIGTLTKVSALY